MKLEEKQKLKNTIEELGFKEERDYNGKTVLKNNIPIKKTMNYGEVEHLVSRLKGNKAKQSSRATVREEHKENKENTGRQTVEGQAIAYGDYDM